MKVSLIAAMSRERVIGYEGKIPWKCPSDLRRFKKLTMGKTVIMGRKTFESIGKALSGRTSIVLSRDPNFKAEGCLNHTCIANALKIAPLLSPDLDPEIFIIGGSQIYVEALQYCHRLHLTLIDGEYKGDTWFPRISGFMYNWKLVELESEPPMANSVGYTYGLFEERDKDKSFDTVMARVLDLRAASHGINDLIVY